MRRDRDCSITWNPRRSAENSNGDTADPASLTGRGIGLWEQSSCWKNVFLQKWQHAQYPPGLLSEKVFRTQGGPFWTSWSKGRVFLTILSEPVLYTVNIYVPCHQILLNQGCLYHWMLLTHCLISIKYTNVSVLWVKCISLYVILLCRNMNMDWEMYGAVAKVARGLFR